MKLLQWVLLLLFRSLATIPRSRSFFLLSLLALSLQVGSSPIASGLTEPSTEPNSVESHLPASDTQLVPIDRPLEARLQAWQRIEQQAHRQGDLATTIAAQFQQAQLLQRMGFYRRAKLQLETAQQAVQRHPDRTWQATRLLQLGNLLRILGQAQESEQVLRQSLAIAQQIAPVPASQKGTEPDLVQAIWIALGQALAAQNRNSEAIAWLDRVTTKTPTIQIPAQLQQIRLRIALGQPHRARQKVASLRTILASTLDPSLGSHSHRAAGFPQEARLYAAIELSEHWLKLAAPSERSAIAQWLAQTVVASRQIGDRRAESYALGQLGKVYEQAAQWQDAATVTQQALGLADSLQAGELGYQWHWQLGRIAQAQGHSTVAIGHYQQAVQLLKPLRADLAGTHPNSQFSFRDQVEPVYRELVALLVEEGDRHSSQLDRPDLYQARLREARDLLESLQIAELTNYFREACLDVQLQAADQVDPQAAVVYPILLRDRLEVIVAIPGLPLTHHTVHQSTAHLEAGIDAMRRSMRPTSFRAERMQAAQQLYDWLIRPIRLSLQEKGIQTLVFVLDGNLQNVPMAALHDGDRYLVESYRVAYTPSLQLLGPKPLPLKPLKILAAGMSHPESPTDRPSAKASTLPPLPGVAAEIAYLRQKFAAQTLTNQTFTRAALLTQLQNADAIIIHLASHGQFSSDPAATYLTTQQDNLTLQDLTTALQQRSLHNRPAIELLVLSACQTAQGDRRATLGLAGIALRSGARSTLASLWTVNDQSTAQFMAAFYDRLSQAGTSKSEAIRQAQIQLLHSETYSHPYYWAAFNLVGSWL
jgi:CHAT domain-containing protein